MFSWTSRIVQTACVTISCLLLFSVFVPTARAVNEPMVILDEGIDRGLPRTMKIEVFVEGERQELEATLFQSDLGYVMYVLPDFVASGEEPGKDILFSRRDDRFSVRIEKLVNQPDLSQLRQQAESELASLGDVEDLKKTGLIQDPFFQRAAFFLQASNQNVSKQIFVIPIEGVWFKFTRFSASTEAAEGIEPRITAILKTIKVP